MPVLLNASSPSRPIHGCGASRLAPPLNRHRAVERPGLAAPFERLAFEHSIEVDGQRMRVGIAATGWQLSEAATLLGTSAPPPSLIALTLCPPLTRGPNARAALCLTEGDEGRLPLEAIYPEALEHIRADGGHVAEIGRPFGASSLPEPPLLRLMLDTLIEAAHHHGLTHLVCRSPAALRHIYLSLGFIPLQKGRCKRGEQLLVRRTEPLAVQRKEPQQANLALA